MSCLTTEQCRAYLAEARAALHAISTGKHRQTVQYGERRVTYTQANVADLRAYISQLEAQCGCGATGGASVRRPFGVIW
ncbi:MAG: gpW family protein [Porticoccaceae bacterium]|jgi:hypothetical protein|nr:gpW family protein [Porticoccaceae bacterium]